MTALLIALAGGLGAAARFTVDVLLGRRLGGTFPWATVLVNLSGSFLLGLLVGAGATERWEAVLGTGFLGGYTTFSTASAQTAALVLDRKPLTAVAHGLGVLAGCVAAASVGFALGRI
jgi:CrcB protein